MNEYTLHEDSGVQVSGSWPSPLHPTTYDHERVEKLEDFANDLNQALKNSFPTPRDSYPYTAVYVLLLRWTDDDLMVQGEVSSLRDVFERQFSFNVEEWQIPGRGAYRALQEKIYGFQNAHQNESELLIVYYGGHGEADRRGRSIWRANQRPDSPYLTWSDVQPLLQTAIPHVLIILDCCYAANAARDTSEGTTKELLAACARENPTSGVGQRSFTSALIEELRAFGNTPFTVVMLHSRLVNLRWKLQFTPFYARLSEYGGNSIEIAPLPMGGISTVDSSTNSEDSILAYDPMDTSFQDEPSNSTNTPLSSQSSLSSSSGTRVLLAVSVSQEADCNVEQWVRWLTTEAPWDVTQVDIRVENIYKSHSTLVLVSVPIPAWNCLPARAAYHLVGFVKSENLLPKICSCKASSADFSHGLDIVRSSHVKVTPKRNRRSLPNMSRIARPRLTPSRTYNLRSRLPHTNDQEIRISPQMGQPRLSTNASIDDLASAKVTKTSSSIKTRASGKTSPRSMAARISPNTSQSASPVSPHQWSPEEDSLLVNIQGECDNEGFTWASITERLFPNRTPDAVRLRHDRIAKLHQTTHGSNPGTRVVEELSSPTNQRKRSPLGMTTPQNSKTPPVADFLPTPASGEAQSKPWIPDDDAILLQARQQGLNWGPIAERFFPSKTGNACRKRHERLVMKNNSTGDWGSAKTEALARLYMEFREQMWKILAAKLDERWETVETKCMEKGLKTLQNHGRRATSEKKTSNQGEDDDDDTDDDGFVHSFADSGLGSDMTTKDDIFNNAHNGYVRVGHHDRQPSSSVEVSGASSMYSGPFFSGERPSATS